MRLFCYSLSLLIVSVGTAADTPKSAAKRQEANAFPPGMIAMFEGSSCPDGWTDEPLTQGRIPIGAAAPAEVGEVVGEAFANKKITPHSHAFSVFGELPDSPMNLYNTNTARWVRPQQVEFAGVTSERDNNLPFYALPMCRQSVQP